MSLPNPLGIPPPPQQSVVFPESVGPLSPSTKIRCLAESVGPPSPPPQKSVVFSNPLGIPLTFLNNPLSSRIRGQSLFPLKRIRQSLRRGLREREQSHPPVPASPSPLPHPLLCLPSQSASSSNPRSSTFLAAHTENMLPC